MQWGNIDNEEIEKALKEIQRNELAIANKAYYNWETYIKRMFDFHFNMNNKFRFEKRNVNMESEVFEDFDFYYGMSIRVFEALVDHIINIGNDVNKETKYHNACHTNITKNHIRYGSSQTDIVILRFSSLYMCFHKFYSNGFGGIHDWSIEILNIHELKHNKKFKNATPIDINVFKKHAY